MNRVPMISCRDSPNMRGPGIAVTGSFVDQAVTLFQKWPNGSITYVDHITEGERLISRFESAPTGMYGV